MVIGNWGWHSRSIKTVQVMSWEKEQLEIFHEQQDVTSPLMTWTVLVSSSCSNPPNLKLVAFWPNSRRKNIYFLSMSGIRMTYDFTDKGQGSMRNGCYGTWSRSLGYFQRDVYMSTVKKCIDIALARLFLWIATKEVLDMFLLCPHFKSSQWLRNYDE